MKTHISLLLLLVLLLVSGCGGGGAAFGLLGVAVDSLDDDNGGTAVNVTVQGAVEVPAAAAAPVSPILRAFAQESDAVHLYGSTDGITFSKLSEGLVTAGIYSFTGTYRSYYLKVMHVATGHNMFIGRVPSAASGAITIPITFDTSSVILTKVFEVQGYPSNIVCGDAVLSTLKTSAETAAKATVNADLKTALAQIVADSTEVTVANLGMDIKITTTQKLLTVGTYDLGAVTVGEKVWSHQKLRLYDQVNQFTFTLYNSETDSVYLSGTFATSADSASLTVTSVSNFPVDSTNFATMDAVGEIFSLSGITVQSSGVITAVMAGNSVTMTKEVAVTQTQ
jgi:hypothetical protein